MCVCASCKEVNCLKSTSEWDHGGGDDDDDDDGDCFSEPHSHVCFRREGTCLPGRTLVIATQVSTRYTDSWVT